MPRLEGEKSNASRVILGVVVLAAVATALWFAFGRNNVPESATPPMLKTVVMPPAPSLNNARNTASNNASSDTNAANAVNAAPDNSAMNNANANVANNAASDGAMPNGTSRGADSTNAANNAAANNATAAPPAP